MVAVNADAGRRSVNVDRLRSTLDGVGLDYELVMPVGSDEMTAAIVTAVKSGQNHIALVGGDGTVNLAINALMPLDTGTRPVIGILPAGTGCDLLRTFGISQKIEEAAKHLVTDDVYAIDVAEIDGEWGRRHFVNVAQAGVGAAAAQTAPKISRRFGASRYPAAFAARLPRFPKAEITLTTDRRTVESEALAVIFANAQFFAGGWNVAPRATLIDGVLDIQIIDASKSRAPALVPKVVKGTHLSDRAVRRLSVAEFDLKVRPVWPVEVDGDYLGNTDISGRVVPAAINLKI